MSSSEKIVLIGNYKRDGQESMLRFALLLQKGFIAAGFETDIWHPQAFFGTLFDSTTTGIGKWLGYIDKWLIFCLILKWRTLRMNQDKIRFHVCDHSNAPYLNYLPSDSTSITCHDVLAIRGALGYKNAYNDASQLGKILQSWICKRLINGRLIAAVSALTLVHLEELAKKAPTHPRDWRVIHNAFNADFRRIEEQDKFSLLKQHGLFPQVPFILHVGSCLIRKNRRMLLDMVHVLGHNWKGKICFAGEPMDENLNKHAKALGLQERVISIVKPDHDTLVALYNGCEAFIFPSFSEGFGWPLIEAQACGAPVIASNIQPMPEISGGYALHADPTNPEEFANAFLSLSNQEVRSELIEKGLNNVKRFSSQEMTNAYLELHGLKHVLAICSIAGVLVFLSKNFIISCF